MLVSFHAGIEISDLNFVCLRVNSLLKGNQESSLLLLLIKVRVHF